MERSTFVDEAENRVHRLSAAAVAVGSWGSAGEGPGEFDQPVGVAVDAEGNVYVADSGNARIQKFTR